MAKYCTVIIIQNIVECIPIIRSIVALACETTSRSSTRKVSKCPMLKCIHQMVNSVSGYQVITNEELLKQGDANAIHAATVEIYTSESVLNEEPILQNIVYE